MLTMSIDQKKEYLKSYRFAKLEQTILEEELMELELSRNAPSHLLYSSPHNKSHNDYSQYLSLLDTQILRLQHKRLETIQRYCNIISCIETVADGTEQIVLRLKYIHGYTLESIAEIMNYSLRQVNNIHKKALTHLTINELI